MTGIPLLAPHSILSMHVQLRNLPNTRFINSVNLHTSPSVITSYLLFKIALPIVDAAHWIQWIAG